MRYSEKTRRTGWILLATTPAPVLVIVLCSVLSLGSDAGDTLVAILSLISGLAGGALAMIGYAGVFHLRWATELRREDAKDLAEYGRYLGS